MSKGIKLHTLNICNLLHVNHFSIKCCLVTKSCPNLCDPMDCSLPGSSVQGILQARILEWVAISFSRGSSQPRDWTGVSYVSCTGRQVLYHWCQLGSPGIRWELRLWLLQEWNWCKGSKGTRCENCETCFKTPIVFSGFSFLSFSSQ